MQIALPTDLDQPLLTLAAQRGFRGVKPFVEHALRRILAGAYAVPYDGEIRDDQGRRLGGTLDAITVMDIIGGAP